jgi:hypothetical protein
MQRADETRIYEAAALTTLTLLLSAPKSAKVGFCCSGKRRATVHNVREIASSAGVTDDFAKQQYLHPPSRSPWYRLHRSLARL